MRMVSTSVQSPQTFGGKGIGGQNPGSVQSPQTSYGKGIGGQNPGIVNRSAINQDPNGIMTTRASDVDPGGFMTTKASDVIGTQNMPSQSYPMGKGASGQRYTYSPTSGQPAAGSPNQYANTVGQWDNAQISQPNRGFGKGKG